jgi:hypothetical protein
MVSGGIENLKLDFLLVKIRCVTPTDFSLWEFSPGHFGTEKELLIQQALFY